MIKVANRPIFKVGNDETTDIFQPSQALRRWLAALARRNEVLLFQFELLQFALRIRMKWHRLPDLPQNL